MNPESVKTVADILRSANRICVLTGAGVSAESGIPTFRASDGLWENHAIEDVASPQGWQRNPQLVWDFYHARRAKAGSVLPNPGHAVLAQLEQRFGDRFTLVTQNVDGLHQRAGNRNVIELHGSLYQTRCTECGLVRDRGLEALDPMPHCACGGVERPNIVWFGEMLPPANWSRATKAANSCDVFLIVGTSAVVYPAASLIQTAKMQKRPARIIEFNLTETDATPYVDAGLYGPSGESLPALIHELQWD
ncbi:MAG: NAD-dependent deacylase [Gemmataceae bacterium]